MAVPIGFPHSADRPVTEQRDDSTTSVMSGSLTTWSRLVVDDGRFLAGTQALTLAFRMSAQRPQADGRVSEVRMSLRGRVPSIGIRQ
jgi:hypothetical protein